MSRWFMFWCFTEGTNSTLLNIWLNLRWKSILVLFIMDKSLRHLSNKQFDDIMDQFIKSAWSSPDRQNKPAASCFTKQKTTTQQQSPMSCTKGLRFLMHAPQLVFPLTRDLTSPGKDEYLQWKVAVCMMQIWIPTCNCWGSHNEPSLPHPLSLSVPGVFLWKHPENPHWKVLVRSADSRLTPTDFTETHTRCHNLYQRWFDVNRLWVQWSTCYLQFGCQETLV